MLKGNLSISHAGVWCQNLQDVGMAFINKEVMSFGSRLYLPNVEDLKQQRLLFDCTPASLLMQANCDNTCDTLYIQLLHAVLLPTDARGGYCYASLLNGRCANQNSQLLTKMQCCCDSGRCWSDGSTPEMCPIRGTGEVTHPHMALNFLFSSMCRFV